MKEDGWNREAKSLVGMLVTGISGFALFAGGLTVFSRVGHVAVPGVVLAVPGLALLTATGYIHYCSDYKEEGKRWGFAGYLVSRAATGIVAVVIAHLIMS